MKKFILLIYCFSCLSGLGQNWIPLQRGVNNQVRTLFADTSNNTLYVGGNFSKTGEFGDSSSKWLMGIAQWNGTQWDSLSCGMNLYPGCTLPGSPAEFPGPVLAITRYNNELYVGGSFLYAGSTPTWGLGKWDGSSWFSIGNAETETSTPASVMGFLVDSLDLYVVGNFYKIGGVFSPKIAKYNGTSWSALPVLDSVGGGWTIGSAIMYKGELYVAGNFNGGIGMKDIARFDGTSWQSVGGGFSGTSTSANKLYVWRDTLYVGGYFQKTGGDPGNNIAAWDGSSWSDVGGGTMPANVWDIIDFQGYLYVSGQINSAGAISATRMARWDGVRWCNPGADFTFAGGSSGTPGSLAVLNNELYAGGSFDFINGDTTNNIAKYTGSSYVDVCDTTAGIFELANAINVSIYPLPAVNIITIEFDLIDTKNVLIEMKNILGQTVKTISNNTLTKGKNKFEIDVSKLSNGMYFIQLQSERSIITKKIIKE